MASSYVMANTGGGSAPAEIAATATVDTSHSGAARSLTGFINVTGVGGTWSCTLQHLHSSGAVTTIGDVGVVDSTGSYLITLDTLWTATTSSLIAVPIPNRVVFTEDSAGTLTADVRIYVG